ncbi:somatostatin receptor type 4-like [Patiria miniata]|uniref:G-protein coupled receptors family 1 profile domain-containing protein n=1 Tax=Patiria miniata TaxID=46514 RepID=A0A913ZN65_PATMI|nr:somatostatin receptor type 4-like [Patiria miniata]
MNATYEPDDNEKVTDDTWICHIMATEAVIGVVGNLLVCFVILRVKFLHNMTNYLLVNLAVADMLLCLQVFLFYLSASECELIAFAPVDVGLRELFCRLIRSRFLAWAMCYASAYNLCVVTLERYIAIVHPLHYARKLTTARMITLIVMIWMISFVLPVPFLFTIEPSDDVNEICSEANHPHPAFPILVSIFSFFFGYLLPLTLMSLAYYKMQVTLKRQAKALNLQHARAAAYDLLIARQNLVSMLKTVLGALIILWTLSYLATLPCINLTEKGLFLFCGSKGYRYTKVVCNLLFNFNSVINPIIYEFKYKKFRQGLKVAFCSCSKKHGGNRVDVEMDIYVCRQ